MTPDRIAGIVLAAGAGTRRGRPKALEHTLDSVSWLSIAVDRLLDGGCSRVLVVLGAEATASATLVPRRPEVHSVIAVRWADGLSESLKTALAALDGESIDAALVSLVDLPDLPAAVVRRMLAPAVSPSALRQAKYAGNPGHPVVLGRTHWPELMLQLKGDRGAGAYLRQQQTEFVDCSDLWNGQDVDEPRK